MPVETVNVSSFLSGSAAEKLQNMQSGTLTPQPQQTQLPKVEEEPVVEIQPFDPKVVEPVEKVSSEELLRKALAPKEEVVEEVKPEEEKEVVEEVKEEKKKPGRPSDKTQAPEKFNEVAPFIVSYLEEKGLIKGFDDGKYETPEDILELLQANDQEKIKTYEEEARKQFFGSMSPAMQTVAQYANNVQNPADLIPFLEALDNVQYSYELDVNNEEHHEVIVGNMLSIQGLSSDAIEDEIKDLKERGKLADRAKSLKPTLDKYNEQQVARMVQQQAAARQQEEVAWKKHQESVFEKVIKAPTVSGLKLKKQDRDLAYAALAHPDPQRGLPIYQIIDKLIESGEFDTLAEIALLGTNKKNYYGYIGTSIESRVAETTQRALRTATTNQPTAADIPQQQPNKISRNANSGGWFSRK